MAHIARTDDAIVLRLRPIEKLLSMHFGPIEVPVVHLSSVEVIEDIWTKVRGVQPPFTWVKDRFAFGTRRGLFGKDFAAVRGLGKGICVEFVDAEWARFVVTVPFPEDTAALLRG